MPILKGIYSTHCDESWVMTRGLGSVITAISLLFQVAVVFEADGVVRAAAAEERLELQADGTFRVVPRLFKQLLVVFLGTNGRMLPAFYALMTSRTRRLYEAVFRRIALRLGQPVAKIMADWETALQGAAGAVWPEAQQSGCWFHFAQVVLRKVSQWLSSHAHHIDCTWT